MDSLFIAATFFLNPVLWIALLAAVLLGYKRVKRERRIFRTRVVWGWTEFAGLLKNGLLYGAVLSVLVSVIGLTVPVAWLIALAAVSLVWMITGLYRAGSFIYLASAAVVLVWAMRNYGTSLDLGVFTFSGLYISWTWLLPVALIAGSVLITEGLLIKKHGASVASPRLRSTSRGLKAADYESKRLWLVPVLFVVPGDLIGAYAPYWPQLPIGESSFSFLLFPVVFGFRGLARYTLPVYLYPKMGKHVAAAGAATVVLALGSFIWGPLALIALAAGAVMRLFITFVYARRERSGGFAVSPQSQGVMIVDVLPDSPADKMGLVRGEVIRKVNGLPVSNEKNLYEAIQVNAAHCRLEVLDHSNELRLRQHVIFRHDHHRLGLIVLG